MENRRAVKVDCQTGESIVYEMDDEEFSEYTLRTQNANAEIEFSKNGNNLNGR